MLKALKELGKDSITYGAADAIGKIIGFVLIPIYTSFLSPEDYGVISLLAYIYLFFSPLASLGVTNAIFRRFNLHENKADQSLALSSGSFFIIFSSMLLWVIGIYSSPYLSKLLVNSTEYMFLTRVAISGAAITSVGSVFQVILRARRMVKTLSITLLIKLIFTILITIYLVVFQEMGVAGVIWANAVGAVVGTFTLFFTSRNLIYRIFSFKELKALLQYGLPYLPHRIFTQFNSFLGPYLIKELAGLLYVGLYDIALKFAIPLSFVISAIQKSWVPLKFQIHREEGGKSKEVFKQLISTYFFLMIILYTLVLIAGPEMIRLMTDANFHDSVYLFPLILLTFLGLGTYYMMGTGFEFTNNTRPMPVISFTGLLTTIFTSLLLSKVLNVYGVIIGIISCQFIMAAVMRYFAVRRFNVSLNYRLICLILGLLLTFSIWVFIIQSENFITRILNYLFIFLGGLIASIVIFERSKDLNALKMTDNPWMGKFSKLARGVSSIPHLFYSKRK